MPDEEKKHFSNIPKVVKNSAFNKVNYTINPKKGAYYDSRSMTGAKGRAVVCASSGTPLVGSESTSFPCPSCSEPIGRSRECRLQAVKYICPQCRFQGP